MRNLRIVGILQNRRLTQDLAPANNDTLLLVPYELTSTHKILTHIVGCTPMFVGQFHIASSGSIIK